MLHIILAGAEVELAPESIAGHPAVRTTAKEQNRKGTEVLLDQNVHSTAIRQLPDGERRGRPDILHYCLLVLLESPLNKEGRLKVLVHTRNGELVNIRSDTRLPRGEARFQGLLSKVLRDGASQDKQPLLWSDGVRTPAQVLAECKGPVVRLDEAGEAVRPADLARRAVDGDLTVVLGAFPAGDFTPDWLKAAPTAASIFPQALNAWAVASEVVAGFRSL
ncbi:MAG: 16S rRNA methyltransferase [Candidatus Thermoplasmatota archaeon]